VPACDVHHCAFAHRLTTCGCELRKRRKRDCARTYRTWEFGYPRSCDEVYTAWRPTRERSSWRTRTRWPSTGRRSSRCVVFSSVLCFRLFSPLIYRRRTPRFGTSYPLPVLLVNAAHAAPFSMHDTAAHTISTLPSSHSPKSQHALESSLCLVNVHSTRSSVFSGTAKVTQRTQYPATSSNHEPKHQTNHPR
jgi:hypothetical protein